MASQGVAATSRLAEMQMRFQRKQMLEREQKKLALTGGDIPQASKTTIGNGKVRQMFDDRRRGVGIDRSHPLRPIMTTTSTTSTTVTSRTSTQQPATTKRLTGGTTTNVTRRQILSNNTSLQSTVSSTRSVLSVTNGNSDIFNNNLDELDSIDNETFPKEFSSLSLNDTHVMGSRVDSTSDLDNNNSNDNDETSSFGNTVVISKKSIPKTNGIKLNPVITKKSPTTSTNSLQKTLNKTPGTNSRTSTLSRTTTGAIKSPLQKTTTPPTTTSTTTSKPVKAITNKKGTAKPATFVLKVKPPPRITTPPPGMAGCQYCQRNFLEERLAKHEEVCRKMTTKKRKIFDATTHRVKGTEAEKYLRRGTKTSSVAPKPALAAVKPTQGAAASGDKKSNWRKKHEEFIAAIREAKKVQAFLAKGGKLSDLPPPPPSENPDYIQCPHCSRRFNQSAAERHIPKCANMQHKPKPPPKKRI